MKLHQLRYLAAVAQNGLNITAAAEKLHTSQPGVSKQIKLLEDELGFQIFVRDGRNLSRVTPAGQQVIDRAVRILREVQNIKRLSDDFKDEARGSLSIATTHTQARYVLPGVIKQFREQYPEVRLHLHQGTSEQIGEMASLDRIDFAIATGSQSLFEGFSLLPCYRWHRHVVVPKNHPLAKVKKPTLKQLAAHPIITYVFSFTGPSSLHDIFAKEGLVPNVVLTARDADVIKTYVRLGLGIGIVASMSVDPKEDADLVRDRHLAPVPGTRHLDRLPPRRPAAQVPARLHAAVRAAPHAAADRAGGPRRDAGGRGRAGERARAAGSIAATRQEDVQWNVEQQTRGRYAKLLAGAEAIEIKATIPQSQVKAALKRYNLTERNDDERYIYFFDTPRLDLLKSGIVARARRVVGDEHDSTIKFRPVDPARVGKQWRKYKDFKIEADASEKGIVKSASFSMPVAKGLIKKVVAGDKGIAALFTEEQEEFLKEMSGKVPDLVEARRCSARCARSAGTSRTPPARGRSPRNCGAARTARR